MNAFSFDLDRNRTCRSKKDVTCTFDEGEFTFSPNYEEKLTLGGDLDNNGGGIGAFVGEDHQYYIHFASKYPGIGLASYISSEKRWVNSGWYESEREINFQEGINTIWTTNDPNVLLLEPNPEDEHLKRFRSEFKHECAEIRLNEFNIKGVSKKALMETSRSIFAYESASQSNPHVSVESQSKRHAKESEDKRAYPVKDAVVFLVGYFTPYNQKRVAKMLIDHGARVPKSFNRSVQLVIEGKNPSFINLGTAVQRGIKIKQWNSIKHWVLEEQSS